jgi:hypothetical protein
VIDIVVIDTAAEVEEFIEALVGSPFAMDVWSPASLSPAQKAVIWKNRCRIEIAASVEAAVVNQCCCLLAASYDINHAFVVSLPQEPPHARV